MTETIDTSAHDLRLSSERAAQTSSGYVMLLVLLATLFVAAVGTASFFWRPACWLSCS